MNGILYQNKGENMIELQKINTPWGSMNHLTGGLRPGQLWVIGCITSTGRSSMALNIAEYAIFEQQQRVKIISHEVDSEELLFNMVCTRAKIDSQAVRQGGITPEEKVKLAETLSHFTDDRDDFLEIEDYSTPDAISDSLRENAAEGRAIGLLIVDGLQYLHSQGQFQDHSEEAERIVLALKGMALKFHIPIILMGQLHTRTIQEAPPLPSAREFLESDVIEQTADAVWLLRWIDEQQQDLATQRIDAFLLKQRGGPIGEIPFKFLAAFRQFEEMPEYQPRSSRGGLPFPGKGSPGFVN